MTTHTKSTGFSLWLMPPEDSQSYRFLDSLIKDLASVYQTYSFEPHITLLGGIEGNADEVVAKTQELAGNISSFQAILEELGSQDNYFRAFFANAERNYVIQANIAAQNMFGLSQKYMPHLSLAYGHFSKEQISWLDSRVAAVDIHRGNFEVESIHVYQTQGIVSEWKRLAELPF